MPLFSRPSPTHHRSETPGALTFRALLGATWPLLLGAAILLGLAQVATQFADAARAAASAESLWSKARSGAVASLIRYADHGDATDFLDYGQHIEIIRSIRRAREATDDADTASTELMRAGIPADDVESLVFAHRWLSRFTPLATRFDVLHTLDVRIDELDQLAQALHNGGAAGAISPTPAAVARIQALNVDLIAHERQFLAAISRQARWVGDASWAVEIGAALLLVLAVVLATRRVLARMAHTEASLRHANERFDLAIAGANDGIWDWNLRTHSFYASPSMQTLLGYTGEPQFEQGFRGAHDTHPDDRAALRLALRDYLEHRTPKLDIEYRARCANGEYKWVELRGRAIWDSSGQPLRAVGTMSDISDRKEAERLRNHALQLRQQAAEDLNNALTGAGAAHWAFAPRTGAVLHAHRWKELLGRDQMPDNFEGWMALVHPEDRERRRFVLQQHLDNHTSYCESEYRMQHADGRWIHVRSRGQALSRDASGAALYFAAVVMDTTERVRVRRLELDQFRFLQAIVNGVDTGVLVANETRVSFVNAPFRRFLGYGPHDNLHGLAINDLVAPVDRERAAQRRAKVLSGVPVPPEAITLNTRDGTTVQLLVNLSTFMWNDVPHLISSATPISEAEVLGMRMNEAQRRFERVLLSELEQQQAHIARELHDSLGSVLAGASLLLGTARNPPSAQAAAALIDNAIGQVTLAAEMSRALSHGLMPVGDGNGGVVGALEQLAHNMSLVKGLKCDITIEADAADIGTESGTHVFRVAQEAINNATRHGKASHIDIGLTLEDDHYLLSIEDNGCGFDVETVPTVRPGIGLQSMMARAKAIRGSVEFLRTPGGGCTVVLAWPRDAGDATMA